MRYNMCMNRSISHAHHHSVVSYPATLLQRIYVLVLWPLVVVFVVALTLRFVPEFVHTQLQEVSLQTIILAALSTSGRLLFAYICALVAAVLLAIGVTSHSWLEQIFLPIFDIVESVPVLALFPVIVALFLNFGWYNGAAVFIIFLSMVWNIVFTLVGGLKLIPRDIMYAARVFGVRGRSYVSKIILPALVPQLVTGSILALAQGWNIIIVAEVLHTYIPGGTAEQDLFGLGSILVHAAANGQTQVFIETVFVMIVLIGLLNFFVWQRLLHYAQKFRFE